MRRMTALPCLKRKPPADVPGSLADCQRAAAENVPALLAFVDNDERFRYNNRTYEQWYGVSIDQLTGRTMRDALGEDIYSRISAMVARASRGEAVTFQVDLSQTRAARWVAASFTPSRNERGEVTGFHILGYDITPYKQAELMLIRDKQLAEFTMRSMGDAMITTDSTGRISFLNPIAEVLTGWRNSVAAGMQLHQIFHVVHETDGKPIADLVSPVLERGWAATLPPDAILIAADGTRHAIEDSIAPICDAAGCIAGMVIVFRDVTEKRKMVETIEYHAKHDPLTGLPNRREFEHALERALETVRSNARVMEKAEAVSLSDLLQLASMALT